jgi:ammonia channel protein AmtB
LRQDRHSLHRCLYLHLLDNRPHGPCRVSACPNSTDVLQVGIAYGGYAWRWNGLSSAIPAVLVIMTCSIQWWIIGYTLAYGEGGAVFGDFRHIFHRGVLAEPIGTIPALLFSQFQLVFEATVCAIAVGGFIERGRLLPVIPFIFVSHHFPHISGG